MVTNALKFLKVLNVIKVLTLELLSNLKFVSECKSEHESENF